MLTVSSSAPDPGGVKTCKLENEENGLSPIDQNRRGLENSYDPDREPSRNYQSKPNGASRTSRTSSRASPRSWRRSIRSTGLPNRAPSWCGGASISAWSRSGQSPARERLAMDHRPRPRCCSSRPSCAGSCRSRPASPSNLISGVHAGPVDAYRGVGHDALCNVQDQFALVRSGPSPKRPDRVFVCDLHRQAAHRAFKADRDAGQHRDAKRHACLPAR